MDSKSTHPANEKADISETENGVLNDHGDKASGGPGAIKTMADFAHLDEKKILRKVSLLLTISRCTMLMIPVDGPPLDSHAWITISLVFPRS